MPSIETLSAFIVATAVFAYIPGPAMVYMTAQTMARGRQAGLMAALGIHLGGYAHVIAAAFGLSVIFALVPEAYLAVKLLGAAYLVWLGIMMFRQRGTSQSLPEPKKKSARRAFMESIAVELLNPKTAIFFIAFLPQFVDPAAALPVWTQLAILGTVVNLMFSSADLVCVAFAGALAGTVRRSARAEKWARGFGGSLLIALGGRLALDNS